MRRELVLVPTPRRWRQLPVRDVCWFDDARLRRRGPCITEPGFRKGLKPPNAGKKYPATPPTKAEMLRLLDACGGGALGARNRGLLVVLWRAGLRCQEALDLLPHDVDYEAQTVTVLAGKGGRRRVVGIDLWALEQLQDWYAARARLNVPDGSRLFCCVSKGSVGNPVHGGYVRAVIKKLARKAEIPHRMAPHQLRHAMAVDLAREKHGLHVVQRQLGHADLGMTAKYLSGLSNEETVAVVAARPAPVLEAA